MIRDKVPEQSRKNRGLAMFHQHDNAFKSRVTFVLENRAKTV